MNLRKVHTLQKNTPYSHLNRRTHINYQQNSNKAISKEASSLVKMNLRKVYLSSGLSRRVNLAETINVTKELEKKFFLDTICRVGCFSEQLWETVCANWSNIAISVCSFFLT